MNAAKILILPERALLEASRSELIQMVLLLRAEKTACDEKLSILREKLAQRDAELAKLTKQDINRTVNQPSSKQREFDKDTGAGKKRKRRRKGRKGAGNRPKLEPDVVNIFTGYRSLLEQLLSPAPIDGRPFKNDDPPW